LTETISIKAPENKRDNAADVGGRGWRVTGGIQRDRERVKWAGADVAKHHAQSGEREETDAASVVTVRFGLGVGSLGAC